jgi:hypothetical protein
MLHSLFGSNRPVVLTLLVLPALAAGTLAFFYGGDSEMTFGGPAFDFIHAQLLPFRWLRILFGISLILINASLLNTITNRHDYANVEHFFPALIFFVFSISDLSWISLNPVQFAHLFTLLALRRLLTVYRVPSPTPMLYDAGLFMGIGVFFFPLLIFVLPILWLGLMQLRSFNLREWLVPVFGVLTPVFYAIITFWWMGYTAEIDEYLILDTSNLGINFGDRYALTYPFIVLTILVTVAGLLQFISDMNVSTVHRKNSKSVFLWFTLLVVIMAVYATGLASDYTGLLSIFGTIVAVFGVIFYVGTKRGIIVRTVFYLWLVFAVMHMYFTLPN